MRIAHAGWPLALLWISSPGCSSTQIDDHGTSINTAESRWNDRASDGYSFTRRLSCFCRIELARDMRVTVQGTQVTRAIYVYDGSDVPEAWWPDLTIDAMFDRLHEAVDQGADSVDVRFAALGYPKTIYVDYDHGSADEELDLAVMDFELAAP